MPPAEPGDGGASAHRSAREVREAKRTVTEAVMIVRERRWVRVRILGWLLLGAWQSLLLLDEFVPLNLESRAIRVLGKTLGLVGTFLIAYGFERLVHLAHARAAARESRAAAQDSRPGARRA